MNAIVSGSHTFPRRIACAAGRRSDARGTQYDPNSLLASTHGSADGCELLAAVDLHEAASAAFVIDRSIARASLFTGIGKL
jgi:hypothetical protein